MKKILLISILLLAGGYIQEAIGAEEEISPAAPAMETTPAVPFRVRVKKSAVEIAKEIEESEKEVKKRAVRPPLLHDVIICLDDSEATGWQAIMGDFALAWCLKTVPIIVSGHLLHRFLEWKYSPNVGLSKDDAAKKIELSDDDWDGYKTKNGLFYVFIPRLYKEAQLKQYNSTEFQKQVTKSGAKYSSEEIILGFAIESERGELEKITLDQFRKKVDTQAEIKRILDLVLLDTPLDVTTLKTLFVTGKDDIFGFWNMIIDGHGYYEPDIFMLSPGLKQIKETDLTSARIAGLPLIKFKELLKFYINELNINIVYYGSCYASDANLHLPYTTAMINEKGVMRSDFAKARFTIISGAITSSVTKGISQSVVAGCVNEGTFSLGPLDYKAFFESVRHYSTSIGELPKHFTDEELKDAVKPITIRDKSSKDPWGVANLPMVKDPSSDIFRPLPLNKNIHVINKAVVQKAVLEKMTTLTYEGAEALLISVPEIPVEVEIKVNQDQDEAAPAIVSLVPGDSLIKFESLKINSDFASFFQQSLGAVTYAKYFYFKKLTLTSPVSIFVLSDVFVYISHDFKMHVFYDERGKKSYELASLPPAVIGDYRDFTQLAFLGKREVIDIVPFKSFIPDDSFLNALVNYFNVNEKGDELKLKALVNYGLLIKENLSAQELKRIDEFTKPILEEQRSRFEEKRKKEKAAQELNDKLLMNIVIEQPLDEFERIINQGADINYKNAKTEQTPLHAAVYATSNGNDKVRLLIEKGALINAIDKDKRTPLIFALYAGNTDIADSLLKSARIDLNVVDKNDKTALDYAQDQMSKLKPGDDDKRSRYMATIKLLTDMGAKRGKEITK